LSLVGELLSTNQVGWWPISSTSSTNSGKAG
jgi:hypothetical protein